MRRFYACTLALLLALTLNITAHAEDGDCYSAAVDYIAAEDNLASWIRAVDSTMAAISQPDFDPIANAAMYNLLNIAIGNVVDAAEVVSQKQRAMALACVQ